MMRGRVALLLFLLLETTWASASDANLRATAFVTEGSENAPPNLPQRFKIALSSFAESIAPTSPKRSQVWVQQAAAASLCPAGQYLSASYNYTCQGCPAGFYSALPNNATSCPACPRGFVSPAGGTSECFICPSGSVATAAGDGCMDRSLADGIPIWFISAYYSLLITVSLLEAQGQLTNLGVLSKSSESWEKTKANFAKIRQDGRRIYGILTWAGAFLLEVLLFATLLANIGLMVAVTWDPQSFVSTSGLAWGQATIIALTVALIFVRVLITIFCVFIKGVDTLGTALKENSIKPLGTTGILKTILRFLWEHKFLIAETLSAAFCIYVAIRIAMIDATAETKLQGGDFPTLFFMSVFFQLHLWFLFSYTTSWESGSMSITGGITSFSMLILFLLHLTLLPLAIFSRVQSMNYSQAMPSSSAAYLTVATSSAEIISAGAGYLVQLMMNIHDSASVVTDSSIADQYKQLKQQTAGFQQALETMGHADCQNVWDLQFLPLFEGTGIPSDITCSVFNDLSMVEEAHALQYAPKFVCDTVRTDFCQAWTVMETTLGVQQADLTKYCLDGQELYSSIKIKWSTTLNSATEDQKAAACKLVKEHSVPKNMATCPDDHDQPPCSILHKFNSVLSARISFVEESSKKLSDLFPGFTFLLMLTSAYFSAINDLASSANGVVQTTEQTVLTELAIVLVVSAVVMFCFVLAFVYSNVKSNLAQRKLSGVDRQCRAKVGKFGSQTCPKGTYDDSPRHIELMFRLNHRCSVFYPCKICPLSVNQDDIPAHHYYVGPQNCYQLTKRTVENAFPECPQKFQCVQDKFYAGQKNCNRKTYPELCRDCTAGCEQDLAFIGVDKCKTLAQAHSKDEVCIPCSGEATKLCPERAFRGEDTCKQAITTSLNGAQLYAATMVKGDSLCEDCPEDGVKSCLMGTYNPGKEYCKRNSKKCENCKVAPRCDGGKAFVGTDECSATAGNTLEDVCRECPADAWDGCDDNHYYIGQEACKKLPYRAKAAMCIACPTVHKCKPDWYFIGQDACNQLAKNANGIKYLCQKCPSNADKPCKADERYIGEAECKKLSSSKHEICVDLNKPCPPHHYYESTSQQQSSAFNDHCHKCTDIVCNRQKTVLQTTCESQCTGSVLKRKVDICT